MSKLGLNITTFTFTDQRNNINTFCRRQEGGIPHFHYQCKNKQFGRRQEGGTPSSCWPNDLLVAGHNGCVLTYSTRWLLLQEDIKETH